MGSDVLHRIREACCKSDYTEALHCIQRIPDVSEPFTGSTEYLLYHAPLYCMKHIFLSDVQFAYGQYVDALKSLEVAEKMQILYTGKELSIAWRKTRLMGMFPMPMDVLPDSLDELHQHMGRARQALQQGDEPLCTIAPEVLTQFPLQEMAENILIARGIDFRGFGADEGELVLKTVVDLIHQENRLQMQEWYTTLMNEDCMQSERILRSSEIHLMACTTHAVPTSYTRSVADWLDHQLRNNERCTCPTTLLVSNKSSSSTLITCTSVKFIEGQLHPRFALPGGIHPGEAYALCMHRKAYTLSGVAITCHFTVGDHALILRLRNPIVGKGSASLELRWEGHQQKRDPTTKECPLVGDHHVTLPGTAGEFVTIRMVRDGVFLCTLACNTTFELPTILQKQILTFLKPDALHKMTAVSRRWRAVVSSVPIEFLYRPCARSASARSPAPRFPSYCCASDFTQSPWRVHTRQVFTLTRQADGPSGYQAYTVNHHPWDVPLFNVHCFMWMNPVQINIYYKDTRNLILVLRERGFTVRSVLDIMQGNQSLGSIEQKTFDDVVVATFIPSDVDISYVVESSRLITLESKVGKGTQPTKRIGAHLVPHENTQKRTNIEYSVEERVDAVFVLVAILAKFIYFRDGNSF